MEKGVTPDSSRRRRETYTAYQSSISSLRALCSANSAAPARAMPPWHLNVGCERPHVRTTRIGALNRRSLQQLGLTSLALRNSHWR